MVVMAAIVAADKQEEEEVEDAGGLVDLLARLTKAYGVEPSDIEPAALSRALSTATVETVGEALARIVRLAATNRQLRRVCLTPLLVEPPPGEQVDAGDARVANAARMSSGLSQEELSALDTLGITSAQYEQTLRGTYGTVIGLRLNERAFKSALATCRTRTARKKQGDASASLALLHERLRGLSAVGSKPKRQKRKQPAEQAAAC